LSFAAAHLSPNAPPALREFFRGSRSIGWHELLIFTEF